MLTDLLIVLALVLLNGVFAMSEIAIVSSKGLVFSNGRMLVDRARSTSSRASPT